MTKPHGMPNAHCDKAAHSARARQGALSVHAAFATDRANKDMYNGRAGRPDVILGPVTRKLKIFLCPKRPINSRVHILHCRSTGSTIVPPVQRAGLYKLVESVLSISVSAETL
jgi:hypothetical protein